jgi:hypothetical protein
MLLYKKQASFIPFYIKKHLKIWQNDKFNIHHLAKISVFYWTLKLITAFTKNRQLNIPWDTQS